MLARSLRDLGGFGERDILHVDTNLTGFDIFLEAGGGATGASEYRDAVAVFVGVNKGDGVVQGGNREADEDGAEDFFRIAFHVRFNIGDYSWADLRTIYQISRYLTQERDFVHLQSYH